MSIAKSRETDAWPTEDGESRRQRIERNRAGIALLDSWVGVNDEERAEQIASWEFLKHALDEDRPPDAKHFPNCEPRTPWRTHRSAHPGRRGAS